MKGVRWVLHLLSEGHNEDEGETLFGRIVTGDGTRIHHFHLLPHMTLADK